MHEEQNFRRRIISATVGPVEGTEQPGTVTKTLTSSAFEMDLYFDH